MGDLLCIALTPSCEAIRKCHGVELLGVRLLTLRSEPEAASGLCFKTVSVFWKGSSLRRSHAVSLLLIIIPAALAIL